MHILEHSSTPVPYIQNLWHCVLGGVMSSDSFSVHCSDNSPYFYDLQTANNLEAAWTTSLFGFDMAQICGRRLRVASHPSHLGTVEWVGIKKDLRILSQDLRSTEKIVRQGNHQPAYSLQVGSTIETSNLHFCDGHPSVSTQKMWTLVGAVPTSQYDPIKSAFFTKCCSA